MALNLLLNTKLKQNTNWNFINCKLVDNKLVSSDNIFGISQNIILPDITKVYTRCKYNILNSPIKHVMIGIQNKDTLSIEKKIPKQNKEQTISLVEKASQEHIVFHIIFKSDLKENTIDIKEPLLCDLRSINGTSVVKWMLDKNICYSDGYSYQNEYIQNEIDISNKDFKDIQVEEGKIGVIYTIPPKTRYIIKLSCQLCKNSSYLIKIDYENINKHGNIRLNYEGINSTKIDEEQCYLLFRHTNNSIELILENKSDLKYMINLKHILIIDIDKLGLEKEDIPFLPFLNNEN